jgi:MFS family permease
MSSNDGEMRAALVLDASPQSTSPLSCTVIARFIVASFYTFCVALTVVGYQALLPVLVNEGVYGSLCNSNATQTTAAKVDAPVEACLEQRLSLDLMFTLATSALNMIGLLVGLVMVRFGSRICCIVGCVIIAAGAVAFAFSSDRYPLWTVGYVLMGAGGPFVAFSVFSLAAIAQSYAPLVIAIFVGVFDASASMMLFMKVLNSSLGWSLRELFGYYLVFPLSLIPVSFWLFDAHKRPPTDTASDGMSIEGLEKQQQQRAADEADAHKTPAAAAASPAVWFRGSPTLLSILKSSEFWLVAMWRRVRFGLLRLRRRSAMVAGALM